MKVKILRALTVSVVLVGLLVWRVQGAHAAGGGNIGQVTSFAGRLTDYVTAVAASIAVLFIAINGVRWTTSGGNHIRQAEAKTGLMSAVVGLILALSANLVVTLVLAALK